VICIKKDKKMALTDRIQSEGTIKIQLGLELNRLRRYARLNFGHETNSNCLTDTGNAFQQCTFLEKNEYLRLALYKVNGFLRKGLARLSDKFGG